jgi:ankyrin repeat protein
MEIMNADLALLSAAECGDLEKIKELESKGVDIHAANDWALQKASRYGKMETVKYLIQRNADVRADDDYSFQYASSNGHTDVAKLLLDNGCDIHADNNFGLRCAAKNGYLETVTMLIVDYKMAVKQETIDWLKENKCDDALKVICSRDLNNKLLSAMTPKVETQTQSKKMKL